MVVSTKQILVCSVPLSGKKRRIQHTTESKSNRESEGCRLSHSLDPRTHRRARPFGVKSRKIERKLQGNITQKKQEKHEPLLSLDVEGGGMEVGSQKIWRKITIIYSHLFCICPYLLRRL